MMTVKRPSHIQKESVWDYPRPPRLEPFAGHIRIVFNGEVIYDHNRSFRMLETSHPPTYYLPKDNFAEGVLRPTTGSSFCEFKGEAHYYDIGVGDKIARRMAWGYHHPNKQYGELKNTVALYAHAVDACWVHDEQVEAQEGSFYGGWINSWIEGPFKGGPGTWGW